MFFQDPEAVFANLARALPRVGGCIRLLAGPRSKSEWVTDVLGAAVAQLGRAPELGPPGAPGPFAFADGDRLTRLITAGGSGT